MARKKKNKTFGTSETSETVGFETLAVPVIEKQEVTQSEEELVAEGWIFLKDKGTKKVFVKDTKRIII